MKQFKQCFKLLQKFKKDIATSSYNTKTITVLGDDESTKEFKSQQPLVMPISHFNGKNIWILKPTGLNRGRGIHVVDSLKECK